MASFAFDTHFYSSQVKRCLKLSLNSHLRSAASSVSLILIKDGITINDHSNFLAPQLETSIFKLPELCFKNIPLVNSLEPDL